MVMKIIRIVLLVLLALLMLYAGVGHLSFSREKFALVVPGFLRFSPGFIDFVVLASGVVEIAFGLALLLWHRQRAWVGLCLAVFFVLVFPGNIYQYTEGIDIPPLLATDKARLIRLFLQPVLIVWALWVTEAWALLGTRFRK